MAVRNVIEEIIADRGYVCEESEERLLIIIHRDLAEDDSFSIELMGNEIIDGVETFTKVSLTLSAGLAVKDYRNLNDSYKSACRSMERKFWSSARFILESDQLDHPAGKMNQEDIRYIQAVLTAVKQKDDLLVEQILTQQKKTFIHN